MTLGTLLLLTAGLAALLAGAELLVRGASRLAALFAVPPLVVGLTVVAYGTSAPELAVSTQAVLGGRADLALGNVVGSNIFNVLFILGLSALITPLSVARRLVRLDVPILIAVSLALPLLAAGGRVGRVEGALMVVVGLLYTVFLIRQGRREGRDGVDLEAAMPLPLPAWAAGRAGASALALAGLGLLVLGSRWLVTGATDLARALGVGELVIGLTVVAAGTSLPEVATSAVAAWRGERDLAVGNVIGSNLFNLLWVLGTAAAVSPAGVAVSPAAERLDIPVMATVAVLCLPIFLTGHTVSRLEGALLVAGYAAYTVFLGLTAAGVVAPPDHRGLLAVPLALAGLLLAVFALRRLRPTPPLSSRS